MNSEVISSYFDLIEYLERLDNEDWLDYATRRIQQNNIPDFLRRAESGVSFDYNRDLFLIYYEGEWIKIEDTDFYCAIPNDEGIEAAIYISHNGVYALVVGAIPEIISINGREVPPL